MTKLSALDLSKKKILAFEPLGALIDYEAGIVESVRRICDAPIAKNAILAAYAVAESRWTAQDRAKIGKFAEKLAEIYMLMAGELGAPKTAEAAKAFAKDAAKWPAFADARKTLKRLQEHYRLFAVTDLDGPAWTGAKKALGAPFEDVIHAKDAGFRKPDARFFTYAIGRFSGLGVGPGETLLAAQSPYRDLRPAYAAGLQAVWIDRRMGMIGSGASPSIAGPAPFDLKVSRIWALADLADAAFGQTPPPEPAWIKTAKTPAQKKTPKKPGAKTALAREDKNAQTNMASKKTNQKAASKSAASKAKKANSGASADLTKLTIAQAREGLRAKDFSAQELTQACLSAIEAADRLNAFVHKTPEKALEMAQKADERLQKADAPDLCGVPLGIKDLFCTEGVASHAASNILGGFEPRYESTVTSQLWDQGAVMLGKLNMDEFAMGSSNESSAYGPVVNPWRAGGSNAELTPGGSSGGSAAAVAADLCLGATGTDTGGSIRQPAAFTGIVGLKPTYGRCSRWGIIAFASSLDQAGPMTKTVRDAAIMLQAMSGEDPKDSTSAALETPNFEAAITGDIRGKKIGLPKEYRLDGAPAEIDALWEQGAQWLRDAGAEVVEISLPHTKYALPAYYIIAPAEASSNLARYDGVKYGARAQITSGDGVAEMYEKTRAEGFGDEVQRRILIGTYVLSAGYYDAYYLKAQKVRTLIKRDFEQAFESGVDAILTPSTPSAAFGLGDPAMEDPVKMYLNDVFTVTVNLAGLPGVSTPAGVSENGLPLGLQLIGKPWGEAELLNVASVLESAAGFAGKPEKWW